MSGSLTLGQAPRIAQRLEALRFLLERAGLDPAAEQLSELVRGAAGAAVQDPLDELAIAARQAGLKCSVGRGSLEQALACGAASRGLVVHLGSGSDGRGELWLALLEGGARKRRLRVFGPDGIRELRATAGSLAAVLRSELMLEVPEVVEWLVTESATPCASATSEAAGASLGPLRRLIRLLRPERSDIWTVVVFSIATGVLMLAMPIAVQALVNFVAFAGAVPPLVVVAMLLFFGLGLAAALTAAQTWIVEILQRRVFVRMVADLAARLPRVTLEGRGHGYGPELVNRFFDVVTIQKVGSALLLDGLSMLLSVLVGLAILAFYHPLLLAFDILLLVVISALVFGPARRGIKTSIKESKAKYAVAAWLEEIARNPMTFKVAGAQQWVFDESDQLARKYVRARQQHYRVVFAQVVGGLALQVIASTVLLSIGGWLVIVGSLTLGQLVAAELIVALVVSSVAKLGKHFEGFYDLMAAVDKVGQLLDLPVESQVGEIPPDGAQAAQVSVRDVRLRASGRLGGRTRVAFELEPGESLAVVGHPADKTRLMQLLWGLGVPEEGAIQIDGRDVRDLAPEFLRSQVGFAAGPESVAGSLRENVRLGRFHISDDAVREALKKVGLWSVVSGLPEGLDTELAPDGFPLSHFELNALLIARAIVGRPRLLLLDGTLDAFSAAERSRILDAVFDPQAGWSVVVATEDKEVLDRAKRMLLLVKDASETREGVSS